VKRCGKSAPRPARAATARQTPCGARPNRGGEELEERATNARRWSNGEGMRLERSSRGSEQKGLRRLKMNHPRGRFAGAIWAGSSEKQLRRPKQHDSPRAQR
jgi:hypothetical protein